MYEFETIPRPWGNSVGITIPKNVVKREKIGFTKKIRVIVLNTDNKDLEKIFGSLKFNKPTQAIMDEIDEGYD